MVGEFIPPNEKERLFTVAVLGLSALIERGPKKDDGLPIPNRDVWKIPTEEDVSREYAKLTKLKDEEIKYRVTFHWALISPSPNQAWYVRKIMAAHVPDAIGPFSYALLKIVKERKLL